MRSTMLGFCVGLVLLCGCGSSVDNATPERAAKSMLAAMIRADSKMIDALNKSEPSGWPTSRILDEANQCKVVRSNISDYRFTKKADDEYELVNDKSAVTVYMRLILVDGRYYAIRCGARHDADATRRGTKLGARESHDNLMIIAVAIHKYMMANRTFPPAYTTDKNGTPLLSWRVLILKYMPNSYPYDVIRLNEPWNSEHNRMFLCKMPDVYKVPGSAVSDQWKTNYLAARGANTIFSGPTPTTPAKIRDGMSFTVMVVEASDAMAVEWSRPDDFKYNPANPIDGLVGLRRNGFLAAMADGSSHFYSASRSPDVLRALFMMNDGKVVNADSDPVSDD
jgi:hypothetical protein